MPAGSTSKEVKNDLKGFQNPSKQSKRPRPSELCQGDLIDVVVRGEKFHVYKGLLVQKVPYFESRLKGCWDGAKSQIDVDFDGCSTETFKVFLDWLYTDSLPLDRLSYMDNDEEFVNDQKFRECYKLADQLMCNKFKNDLVDAYASHNKTHNRYDGFEKLRELSDMDLPDNKLLQYSLHNTIPVFLSKCLKSTVEKASDIPGFKQLKLCGDLPYKVLEMVWEYNKSPWDEDEFERCKFHDHSDESSCSED